MPDALEGLVIARAPGYFIVRSDDGAIRLCVLRGKLLRARQQRPRPASPPVSPHVARSSSRSATAHPSPLDPEVAPTIVAVGDRVWLTADGPTGGAIDGILPRRNKLSRTAADSTEEQILLANLDRAILCFSTQDPAPHFGLLDRYLVLAEHGEIPVTICLNKIDLGIPLEVAEMIAVYEQLGYRVIQTSLVWQVGLEELRTLFDQHTSLLTGPSGVGKSSLLNALEPQASQRVGEISMATHKGRHTTTGVRLFPLGGGGWLADSAGIREMALWNVSREDLAQAFVEFRPLLGTCTYVDCTHTPEEEGCAIHRAVEDGKIHPHRYESYVRLYADLGDMLHMP